ncbi:MAG TPA: D-tyrosyl-tRNA(Tyr) deacylase [Candidatus Scybalomonas excrementigallinarum]|nr:D-tyrosyl-tRNA(Tyr) deacylase [Candidatus Scybalomonas excrementigallinarum]
MKAVIQRVKKASVTVEGNVIGAIQEGLLVLLGISKEDTKEEVKKFVNKIIGLRIFADENGKTNLSLQEIKGELLVVSQFTLYADCKKGRRPSFVNAGDPEVANELYEFFIALAKEKVEKVEQGSFGADMKVELLNDGPFTIVLDSRDLL